MFVLFVVGVLCDCLVLGVFVVVRCRVWCCSVIAFFVSVLFGVALLLWFSVCFRHFVCLVVLLCLFGCRVVYYCIVVVVCLFCEECFVLLFCGW